MKLSERLLKLDQKMGFKPKAYDPESQWERNAKIWWFPPAVCIPLLIVASFFDSPRLAIEMVIVSLVSFMAGFFYNERLRHLGKKSSIPALRPPDEEAEPSPKV